jgi:hypothetical protein
LAVVAGGCHHENVVAPSLSATCSVNPGAGPAPLTVSYILSVAGAQGPMTVQINYGDGTTGADPAAPHTYRNAGGYSASFNVQTATQSALCSAAVRVDAAPQPAPSPTPVASNSPPNAVFDTNPAPASNGSFTGSPGLEITFNMCRSSDPDGDKMNFRIDFEGDGKFEVDGPTGADCRRPHTYSDIGVFSPRMCVTDLLPSLTPAHPYQCKSYVVKIQ